MYWGWFEALDRLRRIQGAALDLMMPRAPEASYSVVYREPGVALRRYDGGNPRGPLLLIVPAPIKKAYIWDLDPEVSVVRRCLAVGASVFLADWQPGPPHLGIADFACRLLVACLDAARTERAILLGHSLGGLFAAVFAALHPDRVRGIVLLTAPLNFGGDARVLGRMAAAVAPGAVPDSLPGSFLGLASLNAAPSTFGWERCADGTLSLADARQLRTHLQVERWSLDEFPLPRQLVADLITLIVRQNRFARGTLKIHGRTAGPRGLTAPVLGVIDAHCTLVPPETVLPVLDATGSADKTLLHYERETGVSLQHVGPLVGRRAHASLWPSICRWMQAH